MSAAGAHSAPYTNRTSVRGTHREDSADGQGHDAQQPQHPQEVAAHPRRVVLQPREQRGRDTPQRLGEHRHRPAGEVVGQHVVAQQHRLPARDPPRAGRGTRPGRPRRSPPPAAVRTQAAAARTRGRARIGRAAARSAAAARPETPAPTRRPTTRDMAPRPARARATDTPAPSQVLTWSTTMRWSCRKSRCSSAAGVATTPLMSTQRLSSWTQRVATRVTHRGGERRRGQHRRHRHHRAGRDGERVDRGCDLGRVAAAIARWPG